MNTSSLNVEGGIQSFEEAVAAGKNGSAGGQITIETFRNIYSTAFQALIGKREPVDAHSANDTTDPVQPLSDDEHTGIVTTDELLEGATVTSPQAENDVEQDQAGIATDLAAL